MHPDVIGRSHMKQDAHPADSLAKLHKFRMSVLFLRAPADFADQFSVDGKTLQTISRSKAK